MLITLKMNIFIEGQRRQNKMKQFKDIKKKLEYLEELDRMSKNKRYKD